MNIGLGLIAVFFAITFILLGLYLRIKNEKSFGYALLLIGTIISIIGILLMVGVIDPYENHI